MFKTGIQGEGDYITGVVVNQLCDWLLKNAAVCCIFQPAFGCCAPQMLVKKVIFSVFTHFFLKKARNFFKKHVFWSLHQNAGRLFYSQKNELFFSKNTFLHVKCYFKQRLECAAPKRWSKYTTAVVYFDQLSGARSTQTLVEIHKMQPFSFVFRQLKLELIDNCTSSIVTCFLYRDNLVIKDQKNIFLDNKFLVANVCCNFILAHFWAFNIYFALLNL